MRTYKRWLTVGAVLLALLLVSAIPVAANPGTIYVDPSGIDAVPCGSGTGLWACETITLALDMAQPGDTIQVASGTALVPYVYTEDLAINIANLTIVSSGGAAKTVIEGAVDAQADADGLTFGQPGGGFTIRSSGAGALFWVTNGPADVTLDSNIFDMTVGGPPGSGIFVDGGPATDGLSVINNTFDQADLAYVGVNIWKPVTDLLVDGNDFNGEAAATWLSAVTFKNSTVDGAVISNNTITGASVAMAMGADGTSMTDITISGNTFSEIVREEGGVIIVEEVEGTTKRVSNIAITGNTFQPSTYDSFAFVISDRDAGVEETDLDYDTISFTCNNVLDPGPATNTHRIVANLAADVGVPLGIPALNAESNWWGTKSGPKHDDNTYTEPGNVAAFVDVSDDVDFLPWLDAPCPAGSDFAPVALDGVWAYSSIQGAIDDATASTIETRAGTFTESVLVDKSVDILGAGRGVTKLEGDSYGFKVISDTVTIHGFHIDANGTTGVWGFEVSGLTVSNNEVDAWTAFGMLFQDTKGNLDVSGNLVHGNSTGIKLDGDAGPSQIMGNEIYENLVDTGIVILDSEGALVQDNYIHHNDAGLYIKDSEVDVLDNTILDNTGGATGVLVEGDSGDTELHGNFLEDNGVDVSGQLAGVGQYLDATCNWWGGGPPSTGEVEGLVDYDPWIGLAVSADPLKVEANGRAFTTITGSLVCDGYAVPDGIMVTFATDLGRFTLMTLQDVEANVPTVDGVASVRLYSDYAGYATIEAWIGDVETPDEYIEEDRLVTFVPRKPSITSPPHRSTITGRRPTVRWTASPSAVPTLVYQLRLRRVRPLPKTWIIPSIITDQTSYRTEYLSGRRYVVKVRACLDDSLTACSRWRRSVFKIAK